MDARTRRVSEVMQTEVATLAPHDRLDLADDVMRLGRVRHMPVIEEGRVVGLVSARDTLAASLTKSLEFDLASRRAFLRSVEVAEVMATDLVTVEPDATLREAAALMVRRKIGALPVVKPDGILMGLITETDLLGAALLGDGDDVPVTAEDVPAKDLGEKLADEFEAIQRMRDELRVQIHLAKADARDLWERTERKLEEVEGKLKLVSKGAAEPLHDVAEAARGLLREIRDGYLRIRKSL
ncbi:MAG: CBS domain-containing protein [Myxococcales bacterium]|nr:CBS domain-containing protein [Myxococcales bacterium]